MLVEFEPGVADGSTDCGILQRVACIACNDATVVFFCMMLSLFSVTPLVAVAVNAAVCCLSSPWTSEKLGDNFAITAVVAVLGLLR